MKPLRFLTLLLLFCLAACRPAPSVTLALLGDVMVGRGVDPKPSSLAYLAPELHSADLAFANLESPLADPLPPADPGAGYDLCAWGGRASLLADWGLDLLSVVNNHSYDCGPDGPAETAALLKAAGLEPVGSGPQAVYRETHGIKLAFLAFEDVSAPLDENAAVQAIGQARAQGALVVVAIHWGAEYQSGPTDRQRALAQELAQAGASLIVGSHPHVLQPAEWIQTGAGNALVLYSLGNALFDQGGLATTRQSALVLATLNAGGVVSVRVVPFALDVVESQVVAPDAAAAKQIQDQLHLP